jgi:PIN domain nuclease of toxin-antitoxin system
VGWWWTEAKLNLRNAQPLPHGDQFDRIITATAATHRLVLLTKAANITDSGSVATLW